jgi:P-type Cu2+ transporter
MGDVLAPPRSPFAEDTTSCLHCGLPVGGSRTGFCCVGCRAVFGLLHGEHLDRFYDLRGRRGMPVPAMRAARRDTKWLEAVEAQVRSSTGPARVVLDVQGLHCVGCVWLVEEMFSRAPGGQQVIVNPSLGRVDLIVRPDFDLRSFVAAVERFGYLFGPPVKRSPRGSRDLLVRLGVCAAISMNSMIFAIPTYAGLDRGPVFRLFTTLNLVLGAAAVAVGGTVFFRSAWRALRHHMLHLDLPIALGIALAFAGSVHSFFFRGSESSYFDTLDVFITLMLLGRWLQERAVERNRAWLLASDGTDGLLARRLRQGCVEMVRCAELCAGDDLLVVPGDLVPVDARLVRDDGTFSLDWIVGESRPRSYVTGAVVPAGAFSCGNEARILRAETGFDASPLRELLRAPEPPSELARTTPWFQRFSRVYVVGVLSVASIGFAAWWLVSGELSRALGVTTSVLIVTCPCAFGIAAPLAYEMVQAGLRRAGLFVRRTTFLDRACTVRRVVFDKTGTLTTGALAVDNPEALDALPTEALEALYDLVARSAHPKSAAVRDALEGRGLRIDEHARVAETPGTGLELVRRGKCWRLGDSRWVAPGEERTAGDLAFGVDGAPLAALRTTERLRIDAVREVQALSRDGLEVWLLSGDAQSRVDLAGVASGVPEERCLGEHDPAAKARFLEQHDHGDTLFVGDGVNDALGLDRAHVSGTPAVDRPYVPARADFFFVTPGLAPIRLALRSARALAQVVRVDLAIALAYNALAIGFALAGRMSPLLCAILMPASSLTTIGMTVAALSPRSRLWRS